MEKTDIIKILKKSWTVGDKYKVVHKVPYSDVSFDLEIELLKKPPFYEEMYKSQFYPWRVSGKTLFNGEWKGGTIGRRYPTLEAALVHTLNNFNENVNIPNHYKVLEDYF